MRFVCKDTMKPSFVKGVCMKFELLNDKNKTVMSTTSWACVYDKNTLVSMSKLGYKVRLDGKIMTIKKLIEKLKEINDGENNQD